MLSSLAETIRRFEAWLLAIPVNDVADADPLVIEVMTADDFATWAILQQGDCVTGYVDPDLSDPDLDQI